MANFTPVSAAIGGALIGLSAVLLMLSTGRIAGDQRHLQRPVEFARRGQGLAHRLHRRAHSGARPRRPDRLRHGAAQAAIELGRHYRGRTAGRVRHPARRRLHLRSRHLRNSPAVAALDRRHHRLHGDGGRHRRDHAPCVGRLSHVDHRSPVVRPDLRRGPADFRHGAADQGFGVSGHLRRVGPESRGGDGRGARGVGAGLQAGRSRCAAVVCRAVFSAGQIGRSICRWSRAPRCSESDGALSGYVRGRRWRAWRRCRPGSSSLSWQWRQG